MTLLLKGKFPPVKKKIVLDLEHLEKGQYVIEFTRKNKKVKSVELVVK